MYVIVEIYNHAVICYPAGDIMLFRNRDTAGAYAEAVSSRNTGVFMVQNLVAKENDLVEKRTHGYRLTADKCDPLKITGAFPLPQTVYTKYAD